MIFCRPPSVFEVPLSPRKLVGPQKVEEGGEEIVTPRFLPGIQPKYIQLHRGMPAFLVPSIREKKLETAGLLKKVMTRERIKKLIEPFTLYNSFIRCILI